MSDERDWSDLPEELIHLISKKLPDLCDFIRFRAVCKRWCSSTPLSDPPPQLPWLLEHLPSGFLLSLEEELHFYSLSTGETGVIHVEESHRGKVYRGPCCGYLLIPGVLEQNSLILFNPLTNVDISLPAVPSHFIRSVCPVWTGSDPIQSRNIVYVGRDPETGLGYWAIYHPGKTEWVLQQGFFYNSCYWDGMFFTTSIKNTQVFDTISGKLLYNIPSPENWDGLWHESYLVELSGVIMRVCWHLGWDQNVEQSIFRIYKLNFEEKNRQPYWVKVSNIGNHMLFLDQMNGFSLKPTVGFKGNCIYFFNLRGGTPCRYDIEAGTFERVPCPFKVCTWFVPSLL